MNFIYPNSLEEKNTGKYLCITKDGNLGVLSRSSISTGTKPVVGEVIWLPFELDESVEEYKRINGGLFSVEKYADAAAVIDGIYNTGDEPEGFMRLPNMEYGQLFARQCSDNLPLGKISPDTFKSHSHYYSFLYEVNKIVFQGLIVRPTGWENPEQNLSTKFSTENEFNETAMKNVVMIGYMRMLP